MIGSGSGAGPASSSASAPVPASASAGETALARAARAYRAGAIDRETLLRIVEGWAAAGPAAAATGPGDPDGTIAMPGLLAPTEPSPTPSPSPTTGGGADRFEVVDVHARGGLGIVYRAIDAELGREVALKQIRPERADDPESRARFEREGTITGALEHPGIVPVYGRGRFEDGRPYFAMRLVRGRSLREAIAEFHDRPSGSGVGAGGGHEATLRSLVGRLVQACLAVEYAHSRGVVHRDLKPDNILLGPFGETLVVDWGLARASSAVEEAVGRAVGGRRSAISNQQSAVSPLARASAGDEAGGRGSDPDGSAKRPPSGGGEGGAHGRRESTPTEGPSPPDPLPEGGERGVGLRPTPGGEGAAGVTEPAEGGGASDRGGSGTESWPGVGGMVADGEESWATRAGHVRGTIGYMSPEQARGDHDRVGPWSDVFGLGATLYCLLTGRPPIGGGDGMFASLARAIRGEIPRPSAAKAGVDPELERICLKAIDPDPKRRHPTARALAEALDEWLAEERARTARALFSSALEAYGALVTTVEDRLGALPAAREAREALLSTAVNGLEGLIEHAERGQSAEVERALAEAHRQLGEIALRLGRSAEAAGHFERSLRAFEALVGSGRPEPGDRRGLAVVLGRLGDVCRRRGDAAGARHAYRRGLAAARAYAAVEPRGGRAQRGLAIAYGKLGDLARQSGDPTRARTYLRRSLAIADALARVDPEAGEAMRGVAMALDKLGDLERQLGDPEAARRCYERAVAVAEAMAEARPDDPGARRSLIISGNKLGVLLRLAGDLDGARAAFGRSMALAEARAEADPDDVDARRDLAICCDRLGDVCKRAGDLPAASAHYARGLDLARSLLAADPDSAVARRGTSIALNKLAELRRLAGAPDAAERLHREALALVEPLADASPDDAQAQIDVAYVDQHLADLRSRAGDADGARLWYGRVRARLRSLADRGLLPPAYEGWLAGLERPGPDGPGPDPASGPSRG